MAKSTAPDMARERRLMTALTWTTGIYCGSIITAIALVFSGASSVATEFLALLLVGVFFAAALCGIGLVSRVAVERGKSGIVWGGLVFITSPFGLPIAWYMLWLTDYRRRR